MEIWGDRRVFYKTFMAGVIYLKLVELSV